MSTWLTKKEGYGSIPKEKDKWLSRNLKRFMLNTNAESSQCMHHRKLFPCDLRILKVLFTGSSNLLL